MKMVEWIEPFSNDLIDVVVTMRVKVVDAIRIQRHYAEVTHGFLYLDDQTALDDFMTIHWGTEVEVQN